MRDTMQGLLARINIPPEGYTLPENYQAVFDALPDGLYVKCSTCHHLHTDCHVTIEWNSDPMKTTYVCEGCTKGACRP